MTTDDDVVHTAGADDPAGPAGTAGPGSEHRLVRLRMPADDEVLAAFIDAQPNRGLSSAIRQLCHMWVNTHGPVSVIDTVLAGAAFPGSRGDHVDRATPTAQTAQPVPAPQPVEFAEPTPHPTQPAPQAQPVPPSAPAAPAAPAAEQVQQIPQNQQQVQRPQPAQQTGSAGLATSADDIFRGM